MFVTLEGVDGAGKSTQARLLAEGLGAGTELLREPGGTPAGEELRRLLKDGTVELHPRTELMLFCAARAELVESVIRPALDSGRHVVCDRFIDSTVAYQGDARGLGADLVTELNEIAVEGCVPDRTVLLRVSPAWAEKRAWERRGGEPAAAASRLDRFEDEGIEFQERIAAAFERIAAANPERFVVVGAEAPVQEVHARVMEAVGR